MENDCKPSKIVPVIINEDYVNNRDNTAGNINRIDEECSSSSATLHPRTCSTSTYFSDQESLPPSPSFHRPLCRSRIESYGSEITECTDLDVNSPHIRTLSFDYDVFGADNPENSTSSSQGTSFLPVPKERYRKRTESDTSLSSTFSESELESSSKGSEYSAEMSQIAPRITKHPTFTYHTALPKIES